MSENENATGAPAAAEVSENGVNASESQSTEHQTQEGRVEFSPDQQKWINQREKQHKDQMRQMQEQLAVFEQKLTQLDPNSFDNVLESARTRDDKTTQVELLTKRIQEMEQSQRNSMINGTIRDAIDMAGVDPKYSKFVNDYVRQNVEFENGKLRVINSETGATRFSADGTKELSVSDVVSEILRDYPAFALKTPTGAGVRVENTQVEPIDNSLSAQLKKLDPRNPSDNAKLKKLLAEAQNQAQGNRKPTISGRFGR